MPERDDISVLLVDDHAVVREGYRRLLERATGIVVTGEAASAGEAYQVYCQCRPDVVVMDMSLPDVSGIEAMRRMLMREPQARVLVFSIHDEPVFPTRALAAGARGYVTKASAPEVLVNAVRAVAAGNIFLSPDVAQSVALRSVVDADGAQKLISDREFEVLRLIARGHTVREIAEKLSLTYKTVANYQSSIRQKLGADNSVQLIRIAGEYGLIADGRGLPQAGASQE
jgi:two-component system, NarL family, invasion response regulator UvrY